ncbi:MAG: SCO family protein [Pseudomonadota bacterium]
MALSASAAADDPHAVHLQNTAPQVQAPGYGALAFEAPAPGTYALPALGTAADGEVLTATGRPATLHGLFGEHLTVLSFIYTRCPDPNGCPLATHVLKRLRRAVSAHEALTDSVQFLSLSFDPTWDTPEVMREYAAQVGATRRHHGATPWRFLTTSSRDALAPILKAYDQSVIERVDQQGEALASYSHILRVYLIDRQRQLRNIYSVAFLHPDVLVSDLLTLANEEQ